MRRTKFPILGIVGAKSPKKKGPRKSTETEWVEWGSGDVSSKKVTHENLSRNWRARAQQRKRKRSCQNVSQSSGKGGTTQEGLGGEEEFGTGCTVRRRRANVNDLYR